MIVNKKCEHCGIEESVQYLPCTKQWLCFRCGKSTALGKGVNHC